MREFAHLLTSPINQTLLIVFVMYALSLKFVHLTRITKIISMMAVLWLYLCSQPFFSYLLMQPIESKFPTIKATDKEWQSADAIWVLACSHYNNEALPDVSRWNNCALKRLVHAYMMYKVKPTTIVLTGGDFSEQGGFDYAQRAKTFLVSLGVAHSDIISIPKGTRTSEELAALQSTVSFAKLAVVSSASHGIRLSTLLDNHTTFEYVFIPVAHLNVTTTPISLGLPQLTSLEKSNSAFYAYFANIELWFFGSTTNGSE